MRAALAVALAFWAGIALAQDWRQTFPVVGMSADRFSIENEPISYPTTDVPPTVPAESMTE